MSKDKKKCVEITAQYDAGLMIMNYDPCGCPAKFKVEYYTGLREGHHKKKWVCGKHKRALEMNLSRVNRLTGFEPELKVTPI